MEPGHFGVQVTEGDVTTSHRVSVRDGLVDDVFAGAVDAETLVRESFEFLLEREPATSIREQFALDDIAAYYGTYFDEMKTRLG
jgi:hypothetical protein